MKHRTGLVIAATAALLAGCNTLEGNGKDLSKAGEASENAPQKK